jgi:hypothetical protein
MSTMNENFTNLNTLVGSVGLELTRFQTKPTKTGATRVRASLLSIKKLCDLMRKQILAESKQIGTTARVKVEPVVESEQFPNPPKLERETTSIPPCVEKKKPKTRVSKKKKP